MRSMVLAAACLAIGLAWAEDEPAKRPPPDTIDADLIWNFNWHGKKQRGKFIEFIQEGEARGRSLVITQIELRVTRSTRVQVVEHRKGVRGREGGAATWRKAVRRGEGFSTGHIDSTSQWLGTGYFGTTGMKFDPGTRPALEVTLGGGEMWVYAEGYWSSE